MSNRGEEVRDLIDALMSHNISRRDFIVRALTLGVAVPVVSGVLTKSAAAASAPVASMAPVLTMPSEGEEQVIRFPLFEPTSPLDPGLVADFTVGYTVLMFEGLTSFRDPGALRQAESVDVSDDGLTYTFTLRDDLKWSDGTPITAHDYEYAWKRAIDPETGSYYAFVTHHIKNALDVNSGESDDLDSVGVKALDDYTLQVELDEPLGFFLPLIGVWTFMPVPKDKIEEYGDKWIEAGNMISSGPFMLESWDHDQSLVMVPNPNYWGDTPTLDRIEFVLLEDPGATALAGYENDELDYAEVPIAELDRVRNDPVLSEELNLGKKLRPVYISLDNGHAPWDDVRVRQAFSLAVDRDELVNAVFKGAYNPIETLIPEPIMGWDEDLALEGGVEEAQKLLADAGYPNGEGFPEFTFIGKNDARHRLLAPALQAMWEKNLGITSMNIQLLENKAFYDTNQSHKEQPFDMISSGWTADYLDPANYFNDVWHSKAQYWNNRWKNEKFDELVEQAAIESDQEKRLELYLEANTILSEELPGIPLWHDGWAYVVKPHVKNLEFFTGNSDPILEEVYIEQQ